MKNLLLIFLATFTLVSCRKTVETPVPNTKEPSQRTAQRAENDSVKSLNNIIIVDYLKTDKNWRTQNKHCIYSIINDLDIFIDVEKTGTDNTEWSNWLVKNEDKINYNASYRYIKAAHTLKPSGVTIPTTGYKRLNVATIKKELANIGGNFDNDNYRHYLQIDLNNPSKIYSFGNFDKNKVCFSIPFIKSIINGNMNADLDFNVFRDTNQNEKVLIQYNGGTFSYFDFSQNPTKDNSAI